MSAFGQHIQALLSVVFSFLDSRISLDTEEENRQKLLGDGENVPRKLFVGSGKRDASFPQGIPI
jgi:hypothetical protein